MTYVHLPIRSRHADSILSYFGLSDHQSWSVFEPDAFCFPIPQDPHPPPPLEQLPAVLPQVPHPPVLHPPLPPPFVPQDPHIVSGSCRSEGTCTLRPLSG